MADWRAISDSEIVDMFERIRIWTSRDHVAPHKPLVLLRALGRLARGDSRLEPFVVSEKAVKNLIDQYGFPAIPRATYPFWRLQNDGIWEVSQSGALKSFENRSGDVSAEKLREYGASGGFPEGLHQRLVENPELFSRVVQCLLDMGEFSESIRFRLLMVAGS